jgi:hypothetical protein
VRQITIRRALRGWFTDLQVSLLGVGVIAAAWHDNGYNHTFREFMLAALLAAVCGLFVCGFRCPRCAVSFDEPVAPKRSARTARPT